MHEETLTFVTSPHGKKLKYLRKQFPDESQEAFLRRLNRLGFGDGKLDKLPHHWSSDGSEYHPGSASACLLCVGRTVPVDVTVKVERVLKTRKNAKVFLTISMDDSVWKDLSKQITDDNLLKTLHWIINTPGDGISIKLPVGHKLEVDVPV